MKIIGITGTLGAGKGTVVEYLKKKGFRHFSAREFLIGEIKKRNLPVNRDTMTTVSNELRKINGPSFIVDELYKEAEKYGQDSVIESIRTPGEVASLRNRGNFFLLAIDADQKKRYERIATRNSETDRISFEKFKSDEQREMYSTDPNKQNLSACMKMADKIILNNGSVEDLAEEVEKIINA